MHQINIRKGFENAHLPSEFWSLRILSTIQNTVKVAVSTTLEGCWVCILCLFFSVEMTRFLLLHEELLSISAVNCKWFHIKSRIHKQHLWTTYTLLIPTHIGTLQPLRRKTFAHRRPRVSNKRFPDSWWIKGLSCTPQSHKTLLKTIL